MLPSVVQKLNNDDNNNNKTSEYIRQIPTSPGGALAQGPWWRLSSLSVVCLLLAFPGVRGYAGLSMFAFKAGVVSLIILLQLRYMTYQDPRRKTTFLERVSRQPPSA